MVIRMYQSKLAGKRIGSVGLVVAGTALLLLASGLPPAGWARAAGADSGLSLANQFIRVVVNGGPQDAGRFSVSTTGGDPQRADDDDRPLVFGMERPWTSFTTVRIDGTDWAFGGTTGRRAGYGLPTGSLLIQPQRQGDQLICAWQMGEIRVEQRLTIVRSFDTGLEDSVRIEYVLSNTGTTVHQVGLRMLVDTMLGDNDGAPFRVGEEAFLSDARLAGSQVPDFWQAFDSLVNPHVTSQGTLRGPQLVPPDEVVFSNWGKLADHPWDVTVEPGRDFTRAGEYELDSAIALFWNPTPLAPGESRRIATQYGLAGISIARGFLSLGLSSPTEVITGSLFGVIAYVENSEGEARDVKVELQLSPGLVLASGAAVRTLGALKPAASEQIVWLVRASRPGEGQLSVQVSSSNSEPVRVSRRVRVVPQVDLRLIADWPELRVTGGRLAPNPVPLKCRIVNVGAAPAENVTVRLEKVDPVLLLVANDSPLRYLGRLEPGESAAVPVEWLLSPVPGRSGEASVRISAGADNAQTVQASLSTRVPPLTPRVFFGQPREIAQPDGSRVIEIDLFATNIPSFAGARVGVLFRPEEIQPLSPPVLALRPGTLAAGTPPATVLSELQEPGPGREGLATLWITIDRGAAGVVSLTGPEATLATLRFRLRGQTPLPSGFAPGSEVWGPGLNRIAVTFG